MKTLLIIRLTFFMLAWLPSVPAAALDFDEEIRRQEKMVTVRYKRPPHSIGYFLKQYELCKVHAGRSRSRCNVDEAKRQYYAYTAAWKAEQEELARRASLTTGEMKVSLQPRQDDSY